MEKYLLLWEMDWSRSLVCGFVCGFPVKVSKSTQILSKSEITKGSNTKYLQDNDKVQKGTAVDP